jgi:peptidoglycan/xylan/chitin deacetylase (PgdA/CDA1 family)
MDVLDPQYRTEPERRVWLTFDDGPHPANTETILKALDRHGVKAIFFMVGQNAQRHRTTAKAVADAGHWVGNHTWAHPDLTTRTDEQIRDEIERTREVIGDLETTRVFRPPYGARNRRVDAVVASLGYETMLWTVDTLDWKYRSNQWIEHGLDQIEDRSSSLVLAHDIHATTATRVDRFIQRIKDLGDVTFPPLADLQAG